MNNAASDIISDKAPADGLIAKSDDVSVSVKVNDEETVKLSIYVNGLKAGDYSVEDTECNFTVSADKLTENTGDKNVISIIGHSSNEDVTYTNFVSVIVTEGKHAYSKPEFVWNDDKTECTAKFTCIGQDCEDHAHVMEKSATVTKETTEEDCVNDGKIEYKATVTLDNGKSYTDTKKEKGKEKLGHSYGEPKFTWNDDKTECSASFMCDRESCSDTTEGHLVQIGAEVESSKTSDGKMIHTAKVVFNNVEYTDTVETLVEEPGEEPSTPSEEPSTPSEEPSTPSEEPSTPSEEPGTADDIVIEHGLKVSFISPDDEYTYTGNAITPKVAVTYNGNVLTEGTDYSIKYTNNINVSAKSKAKVTVTGKNNLSGTKVLWFYIKPKNISDEDVIAGNLIVSNGAKAAPILIYNNETLTSKSFSVSDKNKKYYSDGTVIITGKGNFAGTREIPVSVVDKSELKKLSVKVGKEKLTYNGEQQRISYEVTDKDTGTSLQENTDYCVVYPENTTDVGTVKFTVIGMGNYSGSVTRSYKINPAAVNSGISVVRMEPDKEYPYVSTGVTLNDDLEVTYTSNDKTVKLTEGKDYKVSYSNNKKVGEATYTVSFIGNYKGTKPVSGSFIIKAYEMNNDSQGLRIAAADKVYTKPGTYKSKVYMSLNGAMLKSSDYKIYYYTDEAMTREIGSGNKITIDEEQAYATIYVKAVGKGNYKGSIMTATYKVWKKASEAVDISKAKVTVLSADNSRLTKTEYTGKEICPEIKVEIKQNGKYVVVPSDQYEVSYIGNIEKGKATVVINALGKQYVGATSTNFTITSKILGK